MKIKLVIWDLDDTLWSGTLADGDDVRLNTARADMVRALNARGVVSAVVSKNDFDAAKAKLIAFGLWDEIVFARIAFVPKGKAVADLIEDMQLRPANVLFVDDNVHNLEEVRHAAPEIHVVDAVSPDCDALLLGVIAANDGVSKSRVEQYRALERKVSDRIAAAGSNEAFLRTCDIRVCMPRLTDNLDFAERIEELANRSNQLNFTHSRFEPGEMAQLIQGHHAHFKSHSVFVWDRYGYHGLVGFAAVGRGGRLLHFFFSCRAMHMGVEEWVLARLLETYPDLDVSSLPIRPEAGDWIKAEPYAGEVRAMILDKELKRNLAAPEIRVMLNCQSASIAHHAGLSEVAETDLYPRVFKLKSVENRRQLGASFPPALVYGAFIDYKDKRAPTGAWDDETYARCVQKFCALAAKGDRRVLVMIPPTNAKRFQPGHGVTAERVAAFNTLWIEAAKAFPNIDVLDLTEMAELGDVYDVRHFKVPLLRKMGLAVADWFSGIKADAERTAA